MKMSRSPAKGGAVYTSSGEMYVANIMQIDKAATIPPSAAFELSRNFRHSFPFVLSAFLFYQKTASVTIPKIIYVTVKFFSFGKVHLIIDIRQKE